VRGPANRSKNLDFVLRPKEGVTRAAEPPRKGIEVAFREGSSSESLFINQLRSDGLSHVALSGRSRIKRRAAAPRKTAGIPSRRNSHCQPASRRMPCKPRSAPEIGPPMIPETGPAVRNMAITLARACAGIQERKENKT